MHSRFFWGFLLVQGLLILQGGAEMGGAAAAYDCYRADSAIMIDGALDEGAWQAAPTTGPFMLYDGVTTSAYPTVARMLWDDDRFYLAVTAIDPDLQATLTRRDDALYHEDVIELFVSEQKHKSRKEYFLEYEVSPRGTMMDCFNLEPFKGVLNWDSRGWQCAVQTKGTIGDTNDTDIGWSVEMSIPWADFYGQIELEPDVEPLRPKAGDAWRMNLYRIETGASDNTKYLSWSPLGDMKGGFHRPDRFGKVRFIDESVITLDKE